MTKLANVRGEFDFLSLIYRNLIVFSHWSLVLTLFVSQDLSTKDCKSLNLLVF